MPPKKSVAPKGVKGKTKAQEKEEKKAAKIAKKEAKGKYRRSKVDQGSLFVLSLCHSLWSFYNEILKEEKRTSSFVVTISS